MVRAHMGITVENGISAGLALKEVNPVNSTEPHPTRMPLAVISVGNSSYPSDNGVFKWELRDFIKAHETVRASGRFNFEECRIPIPTAVRYDRIREFLGGDASPKELRVISLLRYGMPINCNPAFGFRKVQKNHFSAVNYRQAIDDYVARSVQNLAILGPFKVAPIADLCFSPLMSVPKEEVKRRVIMDFSFPPGKAINDGIPRETYLDFKIKFCLPSVQSMVSRVNELGPGCLLYKRDLKGAFRQFCIDPGDYRFTGMSWDEKIFMDARLAMGLRSAAYCCQSVTEIIAKIANRRAHMLV